MSAEAERIAHRITDSAFSPFTEGVIQIQFLLAGAGISGHVDEAFGEGPDAHDRLDGTGSAEKMAGHGFGGVDGDGLRVISQRILNGTCLVEIVQVSRSTVGIDVINVSRG